MLRRLRPLLMWFATITVLFAIVHWWDPLKKRFMRFVDPDGDQEVTITFTALACTASATLRDPLSEWVKGLFDIPGPKAIITFIIDKCEPVRTRFWRPALRFGLLQWEPRTQIEMMRYFKQSKFMDDEHVYIKKISNEHCAYARPAKKGETIRTVVDGRETATHRIASDNMMVLRDNTIWKELRLMEESRFCELYYTKDQVRDDQKSDPLVSDKDIEVLEKKKGFKMYRSDRKVWAVPVSEAKDFVPVGRSFQTRWGATQEIFEGDYLVMGFPASEDHEVIDQDVYIIPKGGLNVYRKFKILTQHDMINWVKDHLLQKMQRKKVRINYKKVLARPLRSGEAVVTEYIPGYEFAHEWSGRLSEPSCGQDTVVMEMDVDRNVYLEYNSRFAKFYEEDQDLTSHIRGQDEQQGLNEWKCYKRRPEPNRSWHICEVDDADIKKLWEHVGEAGEDRNDMCRWFRAPWPLNGRKRLLRVSSGTLLLYSQTSTPDGHMEEVYTISEGMMLNYEDVDEDDLASSSEGPAAKRARY